jgi:hypothetical protein
MVILVKIVKIGQLQMGVVSREPIMPSVFFRLKHSIAEQKKLHIDGFLLQPSSQKFPSDHGDMVTRYAIAGRVKTIKKNLSQNRIENLVFIILGRFPINKTQKWRF